jgi:hypothetical protein
VTFVSYSHIVRFSETFQVVRNSSEDDWFDALMPVDTPLYIDPFLIWNEDAGFWSDAHSHLINFFDIVFQMIRESGGDERHASWRQAANLLLFPEPAEFRLGVAEGSPLGSGSGSGLQADMLAGIKTANDVGMRHIAHMESIALFQGGMGVDRISDAVCNVLKSYFIKYTKDIAERHDVPTVSVEVRNASWSGEFRKWVSERHNLPVTEVEVFRLGRFRHVTLPVLLTPHRFLRDIPIANSDDFWNWSWSQMSDQLRGDFNYDIARRVTRRTKARMARQNPEAVALYLNSIEQQELEPYQIDDDPRELVSLHERGRDIVKLTPQTHYSDAEESTDAFEGFVSSVVEAYKHAVENDSWRLLWLTNRGAGERYVQVLFRSVVIHYCKANDVDLTGESNAGRGPVDFKFSKGWTARALIEIKLARHGRFWDGILAQTPTYQIAEGVRLAFFVAIAYSEDEMNNEFQQTLRQAAAIVAGARNVEVRTVIVDASPKKSASKETDSELLELLRESSDDTDDTPSNEP